MSPIVYIVAGLCLLVYFICDSISNQRYAMARLRRSRGR
jgi:hypothetical protein